MVGRITLALLLFIGHACAYYPAAEERWDIIDYQERHVESVYDQMAAIDPGKIGRAKAEWLKDLSEGTCYGEAVNFMLENGPDQKKMQHLNDDQKQEHVIWVQSHQNFDCELYEKAKLLKKELRKKNPALTKKELNSYKKIARKLHKGDKRDDFIRDILFQNALEEKVDEIFQSKPIEKLGEGALERAEEESNSSFAKSVIKTYLELQEESGFTDIVLGFDFVDDSEEGDHAILVQHHHLRIYDAAHGVHQYDCLENMLSDLRARIKGLDKNTYVDYEYFKHN